MEIIDLGGMEIVDLGGLEIIFLEVWKLWT